MRVCIMGMGKGRREGMIAKRVRRGVIGRYSIVVY
jgi:hypothetical protein